MVMTGVASGASTLQYYTATFLGKWAAEVTSDGRASWLSTEANVSWDFRPPAGQSSQEKPGTIVNPLGHCVWPPNGVWLSELAPSLAEVSRAAGRPGGSEQLP
jgi:hypothetical protein